MLKGSHCRVAIFKMMAVLWCPRSVTAHTHTHTHTEGLADSASHFRHSARRLQRKQWWQQCRLKLILAAVILAIIIIVISKLRVTSSTLSVFSASFSMQL